MGESLLSVTLFSMPSLPVPHLQSPGEGSLLHQGLSAEGEDLSGAALSEKGLDADVLQMVCLAVVALCDPTSPLYSYALCVMSICC